MYSMHTLAHITVARCVLIFMQYNTYMPYTSQLARRDKFLVEVLDDTTLTVQARSVEWLKQRLKEFSDRNAYQRPVDEQK